MPAANLACVLFRVTKRFRGSLPYVYAWCTEFRDSDPDLSRVRLRTRKVTRREGDVIEMEETGIMAFPSSRGFLYTYGRPTVGMPTPARTWGTRTTLIGCSPKRKALGSK